MQGRSNKRQNTTVDILDDSGRVHRNTTWVAHRQQEQLRAEQQQATLGAQALQQPQQPQQQHNLPLEGAAAHGAAADATGALHAAQAAATAQERHAWHAHEEHDDGQHGPAPAAAGHADGQPANTILAATLLGVRSISPEGLAAHVQQLCVNPANLEQHWLVEVLNPGRYHKSRLQFTVIAFKVIIVCHADGRTPQRLASWCTESCPCGQRTGLEALFEDVESDDLLVAQAKLEGQPMMCQVAAAVLRYHLGVTEQAAVQRLTAAAAAQAAKDAQAGHSLGYGLCLQLSGFTGRHYAATRSISKLDGWGIVRTQLQNKQSKVICTTCPRAKGKCEHSRIVCNHSGITDLKLDSGLTAAGFERMFAARFDLQNGHLKPTCLSQDDLPEELEHCAELSARYRCLATGGARPMPWKRARQLQLPRRCKPTHCSACKKAGRKADNWADDVVHYREGKPCMVLLPHGVVTTKFGTRRCSCGAMAGVDGREYMVLRKTAKLAVSLALLYQWQNKMGLRGETWYTFFRDTVLSYVGVSFERKKRIFRLLT